MAGKAKERRGFGKKLKDQQVTNKELYNISANIPIQSSSSAVAGGSQGGGTVVQVAAQDIYMNTYDIVDIDRLKFAVKEGAGDLLTNADYGIEALYVGGEAHGMWFRIPAESAEENPNSYLFYHGDDIKFRIDTDSCAFNDDLGIVGYLDMKDLSNPASPSANYRRIFVDQDNSDHLTVKRSDGTEIDLETAGSGASTALDNLTDPTSINQHLIPSNSSKDLGSSSEGWRYLYCDTSAYLGYVSMSGSIDCNDEAVLDASKVEFCNGATDVTASVTGISSTAGGNMELNVATGKIFDFRINDVSTATIDNNGNFGGVAFIATSTVSSPNIISSLIQVNAADTITVGTSKTLQIPYLEDTTQYASGNTDLDTDFGDKDGCVGIQFDTDESAGSGKYRFWIRADGAWYKTEAY